MKRFILLLIAGVVCVSCVNNLDGIEVDNEVENTCLNDLLNLTDGVVIGEKLRNPYSIEVMKEACDLLYPPTRGETPASDSIIVPNVKYVRFLPADSTEFRQLSNSGLELFNYPLDYDILGDPSDYHDPNLPPEQITWQYTVMPIDQVMPICSGEILDVGYIPDLENIGNDIDLGAVENTAIDLTINTFEKTPVEGYDSGVNSGEQTSSSGSSYIETLSGMIQIENPHAYGAHKMKGIKGVKVRARYFWKIRTAYTNEEGRYSIRKRDFEGVNPRFELRFENKYGFKLGYNVELIMPQTFNMGSTLSYTFAHNEEKRERYKAWVLGTINNAAYDWYDRCKREGITAPPGDLHIWAMEISSGAACPMLNHGTFNTSHLSLVPLATFLFSADFGLVTNAWLSILINIICPDIFVCDVNGCYAFQLYEHTCHELAHATHFQQVGEDVLGRALWWSDVINYEVECGVRNYLEYKDTSNPYEHPCVEKEEKVGITEMWAHAVGSIMKYEYLGNSLTSYYDEGRYWFKPEIIWELYKQGLSLKDISRSLTEEVSTLQLFKEQLLRDNADYASIINFLYVF